MGKSGSTMKENKGRGRERTGWGLDTHRARLRGRMKMSLEEQTGNF
jgi:hypothetical protein